MENSKILDLKSGFQIIWLNALNEENEKEEKIICANLDIRTYTETQFLKSHSDYLP